MSKAYHCDKDGCNTWAKAGEFSEDWVYYYCGDEVKHFCSAWHCAQWIASWADANTEFPA